MNIVTMNPVGIHIVKVASRKEWNDFISLPRMIYKDCKQYVPDLDLDIRSTFNQKTNAGLECSDVQPLIAYKDGVPVGRIAGIINHRANEIWNTKTVRFGFIEFIDDQNVSAALLDAVEQWGREHGMSTIQGPMGITDFDKEGMLIEDFDMLGSIISIYNHPYYPVHMERHGYAKAADWVHVRVTMPPETPEKFTKIARMVKQRYKVHVRKITRKEMRGEKGRQMFDVLNKAYAPLFGFSRLSDRQVSDFIRTYLPLVDMNLVPVIENDKGDIVGMAASLGSLSHAFRKTQGRLLPFGWWHILKSLKLKREDTVDMILIGLLPEYQGKGINALFFDDLVPLYNKYHFTYAEAAPQLETNIKELSQWEYFPEYKICKRRRCYRKDISMGIQEI